MMTFKLFFCPEGLGVKLFNGVFLSNCNPCFKNLFLITFSDVSQLIYCVLLCSSEVAKG